MLSAVIAKRAPQSFAPAGAKEMKAVFCRDLCVVKSTLCECRIARCKWAAEAQSAAKPFRKNGLAIFATVFGGQQKLSAVSFCDAFPGGGGL